MFENNLNIKAKESETIAAIDIGSYSMKVLQINKRKEKLYLDTYGYLEIASYDNLPPGSISENIGEQKTILALKDMLINSKITADKIIFSLKTTDLFIKNITLPKIDNMENFLSILAIEAKKHLPFPLTESSIDYIVTDKDADFTNKEVDIILFAAPNEILDIYKNYLKELGITNYSFGVEPLSDFIILDRLTDKSLLIKESYLILNIGGNVSTLSLVENGILKEIHNINIGSYQNTFQIADTLNVSIDVAEEAKRLFGYLGDSSSPHLKEIMNLSSYPLFNEVKHLSFSFERKYNINIEKVYVSGSGSLVYGIINSLSIFLEKQVFVLDSFKDFIVPENLKDILKLESAKYSILSGLILKYIQ